MFCKYCGKQIEEDSFFCRYCGKDVTGGRHQSHNLNNVSLKKKFTSLPQRWQIGIIVYAIWLLVWVCVLIGNSDSSNFGPDYVLPFFLFTILFPFIGLSSVYLYHLKRKKNKESDIVNTPSSGDNEGKHATLYAPPPIAAHKNDAITDKVSLDSRIEPLSTFSHIYGKMQIVDRKNESTGDLLERFCIFTSLNGIVTRVDFSEETKNLTATDISAKKKLLCVEISKDNKCTLKYIDEKHIDDLLPF